MKMLMLSIIPSLVFGVLVTQLIPSVSVSGFAKLVGVGTIIFTATANIFQRIILAKGSLTSTGTT